MNRIRISQIAYPAGEELLFAVSCPGSGTVEDANGNTVYSFSAFDIALDPASGDRAAVIALPPLEEGAYTVRFEQEERGLRVEKEPFRVLLRMLTRGLYYQRCGAELKKEYAGAYAHASCHTAPARLYENENVTVDASGGWHDAGDYGRYTGPGAVAAAHLMYAYLSSPEAFEEKLDIPESGNGMPDVLNECRWELEWLLKMQRADGGEYHKVTKKQFAPFIMPEDDLTNEYVLPPSHCATAAAAACFALASRVYVKAEPAFAKQLLEAAEKAWQWGNDHPEFVPYRNPDDVRTGWYGDRSDRDERFWAAAELYLATGREEYLKEAEKLLDGGFRTDHLGWQDVEGMGMLSLLNEKDSLPGAVYEKLFARQSACAREALEFSESSGYGTALPENGYCWGSIYPVLSSGLVMLREYELTGNRDMLLGARKQLLYLCGMNALDVCFVTGLGERSPMHIHHRPSGSDGIEAPVPGLVSGGPNGWKMYPSTRERLPQDTPPAKYWLDEMPSADTNEIAVYWNSPAVWLTAEMTRVLHAGKQL